jgi:hypothetical protein
VALRQGMWESSPNITSCRRQSQTILLLLAEYIEQKEFRSAYFANIAQSRGVHALTEHNPAQASAIDSPAQFKIELILASKASQRHKQKIGRASCRERV